MGQHSGLVDLCEWREADWRRQLPGEQQHLRPPPPELHKHGLVYVRTFVDARARAPLSPFILHDLRLCSMAFTEGLCDAGQQVIFDTL